MNLTNQSVPSSINIAPSSSISNTDNTTNDNARCSFAVPHRGRFQRIAIPNVSIILPASPVKRRSPRLSVLYVQKQAQLLEKTTSNETAKAQNRPTIARRGPGRPRKADKVQVLAEKAKNAPKARIPSNSILQGRKILPKYCLLAHVNDNLIFHDSYKRGFERGRKLQQCQNGPSTENSKDSERRRLERDSKASTDRS